MDHSGVGSLGESDGSGPLDQNTVPVPQQQDPRHDAGVHVYDIQNWNQPVPRATYASPSRLSQYQAQTFSGSSTTPQLLLPMPSEHHHQQPAMPQPFQIDQQSYNLHPSSSWSYADHSGRDLSHQNFGFMPAYPLPGSSGQPIFSVNSSVPLASRTGSLSLVYIMIKGRRVTAGFSTDQDFSIIDSKLANLLSLETWPIPPSRQRAILTGVGLVTPIRYTSFTCDIPKLGITGWTTHVQVVDWDWEDPPALRLGKRFTQRLEQQHPTLASLEVNHTQHNARPLTAPPASTFAHTSGLGSPRSVADGATSIQAAVASSTWVRSPTIRPNQLVIPEPQLGYMGASAALTPGGSSYDWGPTSAHSNIFDANSMHMTGTGISPATSFQEHTLAVPAEECSAEDTAWGDFDTTQPQAPVPETGGGFDPTDWLVDEDPYAQHRQY